MEDESIYKKGLKGINKVNVEYKLLSLIEKKPKKNSCLIRIHVSSQVSKTFLSTLMHQNGYAHICPKT